MRIITKRVYLAFDLGKTLYEYGTKIHFRFRNSVFDVRGAHAVSRRFMQI